MKLVLKILALPVLFVVKVICVLGNLLTNVVSYVIGIVKRKKKYSVVYTYTDENGNKRQKWESFETNSGTENCVRLQKYFSAGGTTSRWPSSGVWGAGIIPGIPPQ